MCGKPYRGFESHSLRQSPEVRKLADLAAAVGLVQAAGKLTQELEALLFQINGSLEVGRMGAVLRVHQAFVRE